jgi:hypothetical protein
MRIAIFLFLTIFLSSYTLAQDSTLFVIVSCSEGVMVDGKVVNPGQFIDSKSKEIVIPKDGYAGVITNEGYALYLTKSGSLKKQSNAIKKNRLNVPFTNVCRPPQPLEIVNEYELSSSSLPSQDSTIVLVKDNSKKGTPYFVQYLNMFGEILDVDTLSENYAIVNCKERIGQENFLMFKIKSNAKEATREYFLKQANPIFLTQLNFDISRIPSNSPDKRLFEIAIYQLNHFYYDQLFKLYQVERDNFQSQNIFLTKYIDQEKKKYQFELFDFHK